MIVKQGGSIRYIAGNTTRRKTETRVLLSFGSGGSARLAAVTILVLTIPLLRVRLHACAQVAYDGICSQSRSVVLREEKATTGSEKLVEKQIEHVLIPPLQERLAICTRHGYLEVVHELVIE